MTNTKLDGLSEQNAMSERLEPCPFCGGRAEYREGIHTGYVMCLRCEVMGPNLKRAEAIAAWNRRAEPKAPSLSEEGVEKVAIAAFKCAFHPADTATAEKIERLKLDFAPTWEHANEVARAILALDTEARDRWQPIETAPKDGTQLILSLEPTDDPTTCLGFWQEDRWVCGPAFYDMNQRRRPQLTYRDYAGKPAHWMPLPAPPSEGGKR